MACRKAPASPASWCVVARRRTPAATKRLQEPRARGGAESSPFFLLGVFGLALHACAYLQAAPRPVPSEMCAGGVARRPGAPRRRRHKGRAAVTSPTRRCRQQGGGPGPTGGARGCPSPSPSTPVPPRAWQRSPPPYGCASALSIYLRLPVPLASYARSTSLPGAGASALYLPRSRLVPFLFISPRSAAPTPPPNLFRPYLRDGHPCGRLGGRASCLVTRCLSPPPCPLSTLEPRRTPPAAARGGGCSLIRTCAGPPPLRARTSRCGGADTWSGYPDWNSVGSRLGRARPRRPRL